jgi:hypothetical protein
MANITDIIIALFVIIDLSNCNSNTLSGRVVTVCTVIATTKRMKC